MSKETKPQEITLPAGTVAAYVNMNGRTYYIDDSTGEAIMQNWTAEKNQHNPQN